MPQPRGVARYKSPTRPISDYRPIPLETSPTIFQDPNSGERFRFYRAFLQTDGRLVWANNVGGHGGAERLMRVEKRPLLEGWLDPFGGYVMCAPWGHGRMAETCMPEAPNPEQALEEAGWVRIKGGEVCSERELTDAQKATVKRGYE